MTKRLSEFKMLLNDIVSNYLEAMISMIFGASMISVSSSMTSDVNKLRPSFVYNILFLDSGNYL